jgi:hypothetical protein|tara:strand:+ start:853 stop:1824 length:972 start_codon:yes stop_codon:yes gene_type:complete
MPISRMQQPRQQYGLGSFVKKAFKGVTKGIKKIAKSDLGKAALLAGGAYFAPTLFGKSAGFGNFGNLLKSGVGSLASKFTGKESIANFLKGEKTFGKTLGVMAGGTLLGGLLSKAEQGDEEAIEATQNVGALKNYLTQGYTNLGYKENEIPKLVENDLSEYTQDMARGQMADGGRIKFGSGSEDYGDLIDAYEKGIDVMEGESLSDYINRIRKSERKNSAMGGRIGYAFGNKPEQNAIQAAGIEGLPLNQNPAGVTELDLRDSGGFIPPVGVKEKADDIPAMLANNEFVFTADAVRGMGDGNVNKGAQRMYDMMKKLEKGGRV